MKNNPTVTTTCQICGQRPASLYLTHKGLNKYSCWPCAQWAITAAQDEAKLHLPQPAPKQPEVEPIPESRPATIFVSESKKSRIVMATKEIVAWALAL